MLILPGHFGLPNLTWCTSEGLLDVFKIGQLFFGRYLDLCEKEAMWNSAIPLSLGNPATTNGFNAPG
jgi:hypothetical protein